MTFYPRYNWFVTARYWERLSIRANRRWKACYIRNDIVRGKNLRARIMTRALSAYQRPRFAKRSIIRCVWVNLRNSFRRYFPPATGASPTSRFCARICARRTGYRYRVYWKVIEIAELMGRGTPRDQSLAGSVEHWKDKSYRKRGVIIYARIECDSPFRSAGCQPEVHSLRRCSTIFTDVPTSWKSDALRKIRSIVLQKLRLYIILIVKSFYKSARGK